eukprot:SAG31_NODE_464_length_15318_cov_17.930876_10_plen_149_part_00
MYDGFDFFGHVQPATTHERCSDVTANEGGQSTGLRWCLQAVSCLCICVDPQWLPSLHISHHQLCAGTREGRWPRSLQARGIITRSDVQSPTGRSNWYSSGAWQFTWAASTCSRSQSRHRPAAPANRVRGGRALPDSHAHGASQGVLLP